MGVGAPRRRLPDRPAVLRHRRPGGHPAVGRAGGGCWSPSCWPSSTNVAQAVLGHRLGVRARCRSARRWPSSWPTPSPAWSAGTLGTTATIIRYFQRRGLAVSVAVSSGRAGQPGHHGHPGHPVRGRRSSPRYGDFTWTRLGVLRPQRRRLAAAPPPSLLLIVAWGCWRSSPPRCSCRGSATRSSTSCGRRSARPAPTSTTCAAHRASWCGCSAAAVVAQVAVRHDAGRLAARLRRLAAAGRPDRDQHPGLAAGRHRPGARWASG